MPRRRRKEEEEQEQQEEEEVRDASEESDADSESEGEGGRPERDISQETSSSTSLYEVCIPWLLQCPFRSSSPSSSSSLSDSVCLAAFCLLRGFTL